MNKVILMGRLTRDPDVRYTQGPQQTAVARYTLAVDRWSREEGQQSADFISCVAFGRAAEFVEKYLRQGTKIVLSGRIQTGSYTNREGQKVYTTDVVVETQEFAESLKVSGSDLDQTESGSAKRGKVDNDGFMEVPDGLEDEGLPFN